MAWGRLELWLGADEDVPVNPVIDTPLDAGAPDLWEVGEAQLSLLPSPRVAIEFFPSTYFVTADDGAVRGCFRAWVRGLGSSIGAGETEHDTVHALAVLLRQWVPPHSGAGADAADPQAWVARAASRLGPDELAELLLEWAEEPVLAAAEPSC